MYLFMWYAYDKLHYICTYLYIPKNISVDPLDIIHSLAYWLINSFPLDKMANISQAIFSDAFCEWKVLYFDWNFTEVCS